MTVAIVLVAASLLMSAVTAVDPACSLGSLIVTNPQTNRLLVSPATCGITLNAADLASRPEVNFTATHPYDNYILMMLSTNGSNSNYLNWLLGNIKPNGTSLSKSVNTTVLAYYKPSVFNGMTKYYIYVYRQYPGAPKLWRTLTNEERVRFSPERWINEQPPRSIEGPIAATTFNTTSPHYPSYPSHPSGYPHPPAQYPPHNPYPNHNYPAIQPPKKNSGSAVFANSIYLTLFLSFLLL